MTKFADLQSKMRIWKNKRQFLPNDVNGYSTIIQHIWLGKADIGVECPSGSSHILANFEMWRVLSKIIRMSIDSLPPDRSATLLWQSVVPVTAAVIVVLVASQIPLPGIDTSVLAEQAIYSPNGALARFSIFALGIMPLFTVLAHVEIAKLVFPSLARCQIAFSGNVFGLA